MDFFERQDRARKATRTLIFLFALSVVCITAAIYAVVDVMCIAEAAHSRASERTQYDSGPASPAPVTWWDPVLFEAVAAGVLAIVFFGSAHKIVQLRQGGGVVASILGGTPLNINTTDPDEKRLLNVVEEMAIASGIPVPQIYILYDDDAINAFAAGNSKSNAAIGVTIGAIKLLSRDELQGVVAHEFSHMLNGDMVLNMRLLGIVFGIECIAKIGELMMRARGRNTGGITMAGLAVFLIGLIGILFGQMIRSAISRQREYLADASAVQFTRNPAGIAGALKKIGGSTGQSYLKTANAGDMGHFLFGSGSRGSMSRANLFATHPPLPDRIRAIDPQFDGKFIAPAVLPVTERTARTMDPNAAALAIGLVQAPRPAAQPMLSNIGAPDEIHLKYAAGFRATLPGDVSNATRETAGACGLMCTLLISPDAALQRQQLAQLQPQADPAIYGETVKLLPGVLTLKAAAKLPLIDLALPALRQLSPAQYTQFRAGIALLINSDSQVDLFEYCLQKVMTRNLDSYFSPAPRRAVQYQSLAPLLPDCAILLSTLAYLAHGQSELARGAFQQGARQLNAANAAQLAPADPAACTYAALDAALDRLNQSTPYIKKNVLYSCGSTVMADGRVQVEEWELLRAIADTLDCPIPPFVETSAQALIMEQG